MVHRRSETEKSGTLFIISAPSGTGKTTLCKKLRKRFPDLKYSISYTTREPREGEKHGRDYYFISEASFREKMEKDLWAEWAKVHDHYYGTSRSFIDKNLLAGRDILLDIDVKGTKQILTQYPDSITIFVMPPAMDVLRSRLEKRGTESQSVIDKRLLAAETEMAQKTLYRHVIVNDRLEDAARELISFVQKNRF